MSEEYNLIVQLRGRFKGSITRALTYAENPSDDFTAEQIADRLERLQEAWQQFVGATDSMYKYAQLERYIDPEVDYAVYEEKYLAARGLLLTLKKSLPSNENAEHGGQADGAITKLVEQQALFLEQIAQLSRVTPRAADGDLPKINIPPFSGNYMDWPSFRDLFLSAIDSKAHISNAQKYHYLTSLLRDEAATLVKHLPVTDTAYDTAWTRLNDRFDRPRQIVNSFIDRFMNLPSVSHENVTMLRKVSDGANEVVRGLASINHSERDCWLIHLLVAKLDPESRRRWISDSKDDTMPSIEDFLDFLDSRCEEIELSQPKPNNDSKGLISARHNKPSAHSFVAIDSSNQLCANCSSKEHSLAKCSHFLSLNVDDRRLFVKSKSLCFNCLKAGHTSYSCANKFRCRECRRRHHTLVHPINASLVAATLPALSADNTSHAPSPGLWSTTSHVARPEPFCSSSLLENSNVVEYSPRDSGKSLLPTALINVHATNGRTVICRVLLDCASELSYITERCAQSLALPRSHARIAVTGISSVHADSTRGFCTLRIGSRVNSKTLDIRAHVLSKITADLPQTPIDNSAVEKLSGLVLADPSFNIPSQIDILLGAQYVWDIFTSEKMFDFHGKVCAVSSIFGWIVTSMPFYENKCSTSLVSLMDIDNSLKKFSEIEEAQMPTVDADDRIIEQPFSKTHSRHADGRYVVELPIRQEDISFADTMQGALSRFLSVEHRLLRESHLRKHTDVMHEYLHQDHMRKLRHNKIAASHSFKDANGLSLNSVLYTGPNIQRDLFSVCFRFRLHRFVFSADIVKMFRQIWVDEKHRNYQRIVWRDSPSEPIEHFQLCTVTYGTSCAPFLAVRVLKQLSHDYCQQFPRASRILSEDFYVDDVLTGAATEQELLELKEELVNLMSCAGLELRKWVSNCESITSNLQDQSLLKYAEGEATKVLGLLWKPQADILAYKVCIGNSSKVSKRQLLSDVSRIFDPLGLLSPVTVQYKILFQHLWLQNLDWDTPLPPTLGDTWRKYRDDMHNISRLSIPRHVAAISGDQLELQGFCDASLRAYAAVVYCRAKVADGSYHVTLVAAKTRVAPLKQLSLPRLELCGALLLTRLINEVKKILPQTNITVNAWCDSTIVLAWLSQPPVKMKTFVANRTAEIIDALPRSVWNHVASKDNPADCASRGMLAADLIQFQLWWNGPPWLQDAKLFQGVLNRANHSASVSDPEVVAEIKTTTVSLVLTNEVTSGPISALVTKSSSWQKLIRILAYVMRIIKRFRPRNQILNIGHLLFDELADARRVLLRHAQECFAEDRDNLRCGKELSSRSTLLKLTPFIDEHGLIRVGGRIQNSLLESDEIHPIILPKDHRITLLILEEEHIKNLHAGVSALFVIVRQKYWVFGARNLIRSLTFKCLKCFRQRQISTQQFMADLPSVRVRQAYPFENAGCDYAGPLTLKMFPGRNPRFSKGYICLFVCLATSAIHLELATDLSTDCFLAALRRFMSRRGKCSQIFSDNGRNFLGASRLLNEMHKLIMSQTHNEIVSASLAKDGIRWSYIPPYAPHWGGIWESAVRSVKLHLRRVLGNSILTFEQMNTLLAQIEAVVNSRPLGMASDTDNNYLSPSHFLIGRPYTMVPEGSLVNVQPNKLDYWQHVQSMVQGFWQRWHHEYLTSLQQRPKWFKRQPNIDTNSIVVVKESNIPPAKWLIARVIESYPGADGLTRVVKLKTAHGEMIRPITKIVVLPAC